MIVITGVGFFVAAIVLLWIARPRNGEMASFLRGRWAEEMYTVVVVGCIGLGLACIFGGLVGMGGG
jgi:hypothetical protein